ncbi:hypothetical protein DYB37_013479 [Aphanomyces astaci]|uniref:Integrase zinc-binding domain-containing protein n=1 Tax=Aphanomyces astaci TaxID=112090 RepID=A0A3R7F2U2_APHAT|nr:hypothetical protein DYB37_013479 [Aphanomyces astaci]
MLLTRYMLVNKIVLGMADGPITLLHVSAWIDETDDGANITLGRKVMETLGYDLEGFLKIAREQRDVWDLADTVATDDSAPTALERVFKTWHRGTVDEPDPVVDDEDDNSAAYAPDADHDTVVKELLLDAVRAAQANGLSEAGTREVHSLVMAAIDVFRVAPRNEPPVAIAPLKVVLQQGAVRRLVTVPPVTPLPLGADFEWPTLESLTIVQRKAKTEFTKIKASLVFDNPDGIGRINGCIWIPASALDTQLTLLVIAHAGAMGHRGQAATRAALTGTFSWRNVTEDVALSRAPVASVRRQRHGAASSR